MHHRSQNHSPLRRGGDFRPARPDLALVTERRKNRMRKVYIAAVLILSAAILLSNPLFREVTAAHDEDKEEHLFVWAGDQARANADFLAVINFDQHSKHYGDVITTFPLPTPAQAATNRITSGSRLMETCWRPADCSAF